MLKTTDFFLLLFSFFISFFLGCSAYGLLNNNEGLYAQIGWETLQNNHWIIPHLNDLPYLEKPPMLYWLLALSFKLFGKTVFAARLIPACAGAATSLSLLWWGRTQQKPDLGFYASFVLNTCLGFIIFSRMIFFDGLLTLWLTLTLLHFFLFYQKRQRANLLWMMVFLACAVLTKGLLSLFLVGGTLFFFLLWERQLPFLIKLFHLQALLLFLGLTVPWHWLAAIQNKHFAWFYFVNEHFLRFLDLRIPKDYYTGSSFYYVPRLWASTLPWGLVLPFVFFRDNNFFTRNFFQKLNQLPTQVKFLLVWLITFFMFFSLSQAKANYYLMTGLPPLAVLLAWAFPSAIAKFGKKILFSITALVTLALVTLPRFEDQISCANFFRTHPHTPPLILYKRMEELSSLLFYSSHPLPILHSESRDLWFAQQNSHRPDLFLTDKTFPLHNHAIAVLKRDWTEFQKSFPQATLLYSSPLLKVFTK